MGPLRQDRSVARSQDQGPAKASRCFLPLAYHLRGRNVLIVGAGRVGLRKLAALSGNHARITVVAPEISRTLTRPAGRSRVTVRKRRFRTSDLIGQDLVFAMSDDERLNHQIAVLCRRRGILCNAATGQLQDFLMMSLVARGDLKIAVSTGGAVPFLTRAIRRHLEKIFASDWGKRLERLERLRFGLLKRGDTAGLARLSRLKFADLRRY